MKNLFVKKKNPNDLIKQFQTLGYGEKYSITICSVDTE